MGFLFFLSFLGSWGTYWGELTAAGMLVLLPPVILFLFFQKWFIAGIFGQQLKRNFFGTETSDHVD